MQVDGEKKSKKGIKVGGTSAEKAKLKKKARAAKAEAGKPGAKPADAMME